ncbi:MAG: MBL fold metallo-hydrolase [Methyloligellaceae bacterium]
MSQDSQSHNTLPFNFEINFTYREAVEVAPDVHRIVARNPGPFTFKGTNSYLIGSKKLALIDPGPELEEQLESIIQALDGRELTHIVLTHSHRDHADGVENLKQVTGAKICSFRPTHRIMAHVPGWQAEESSYHGNIVPEVELEDGDVVEGNGWALQAIHTPGHAPDHICLEMRNTGLVFSGDHVMSWNTSSISPPEGSMSAYIRSLETLLARDDDLYFPGHGGRIQRPRRVVKAYLLHRGMREKAILDTVETGMESVATITDAIYPDLDESLRRAAEQSVKAHLIRLVELNKIMTEGSVTMTSVFRKS